MICPHLLLFLDSFVFSPFTAQFSFSLTLFIIASLFLLNHLSAFLYGFLSFSFPSRRVSESSSSSNFCLTCHSFTLSSSSSSSSSACHRTEDSGLLTHKTSLPVRSLVLGDVHRPGSEAAYRVGPLRCHGDSEFICCNCLASDDGEKNI